MTDKQPVETKPTPDPTILTTEQLLREIERAITLLKTEMAGHQESDSFRFDAIKERLDMIEEWRKEQKVDAKIGIDAALQSAKEASREQVAASEKAIAKSEAAMTTQSQQQYATFTESLKGLASKLDSVKERQDRFESMGLGVAQNHAVQRQENVDGRVLLFSVITVAMGLMALAATIVIAVTQ